MMKSESVALLNQIKSLALNDSLDSASEDQVKTAFRKILESGDTFNITELENWFLQGSTNQSVIDRIINIAHYQKTKFDASNKFKIVSDGCGCSH